MHEREYSEAVVPRHTTVLLLSLRPYSIAHEIWLTARGNPLAAGELDGLSLEQMQAALVEAVMICAQTHAEILAMDRDRLLTLKIRVWQWRIRKLLKYKLALELGKFLAYRGRGLDGPPLEEMPLSCRPGRPAGAPFVLRLKQFLVMRLGLKEAEALDYPLCRAQWEWAAWGESEELARIRNEHDDFFNTLTREVDRRVAAGGDFEKTFLQVRTWLENGWKPNQPDPSNVSTGGTPALPVEKES